MKKVYIYLSFTGTYLSRVIRTFQSIEYSHASIGFEDDLENVYSFGRKHRRYFWYSGFVVENIEERMVGWFPNTRMKVLEIEVPDEVFYKLKENVAYFNKNEKHFQYNLIGLLGVVLNRPIYFENKFFCSHFVAYLFEISGYPLIDKPALLVSPKDFFNLEDLTTVFEGRAWEYCHHVNSLPKYRTASFDAS